jgi:hypothetical protein
MLPASLLLLESPLGLMSRMLPTSLAGITSVADVSIACDPVVATGPDVAGVPAVCVKTKVLSHQTTTNERNFICFDGLWNIEY